nr:hypothetical protein [Dorea sp. D27]
METIFYDYLYRRKEQRQIRRLACEEKETYNSKNPAHKYERTGILADRAPIEHRCCTESKQDTEEEYKYIENYKTPPDNTRVCVKNYYYRRHSKQDSEQTRTEISGEGRPAFVAVDKGSHEKIREKQQFQMFPYRFIDRTKKSSGCAFTCPLIQEMVQASKYGHSDDVWKICFVI